MRRVAGILLFVSLLVGGLVPAARSGSVSAPETITLEGQGALFGLDAGEDVTVQVDDNPLNRADAWAPQDPGTKRWMTLDYGPYLIHPGSDLSRMDVEIAGQNGYAVGFEPIVIDAVTGKPFSSHTVHIHHAHWYWLDPEQEGLHRWFYGTGEERTQGSLWPIANQDPRSKSEGLRYGVKLNQGDRLGFLSMLHNKSAEALQVYLRVRIQYVYGTHDTIKEAEGWDFHDVRPTLIGTTFNVPKGGVYDFPLDTDSKKEMGPHSNYHNPVGGTEVVPGVGQVVTMPFSGTVIVGAGHMHPGGKEVVVSNMGSKEDPCADDGDRFPGVTAVRSKNITRGDVFPSEEYQMGLTQPAWRMYVRKGDRLAINGVYDASKFAYPDAMSYFGFYTDTSEKTKPSEACKVELIGDPKASPDEITRTTKNQEWAMHHPLPTCHGDCDKKEKQPEPGAETNVVHIAGFLYLPGQQGVTGQPAGPPVVRKGDELTFINEDYALGGVRHSVTSCKAPCNGEYQANYPMHDGDFHSGALGYTWQETYINAKDEPRWSLDTSKMKPGYYTYYCQLHAWMRGSFYVK